MSDENKQRMITRFGFGKVIERNDQAGTAKVKLEIPFNERKVIELNQRREIFPFTDYAVLKVVNSSAARLTNVQYYPDRETMDRALQLAVAPDETWFGLDFQENKFEVNQELSPFEFRPYMKILTWVDRWGREESEFFSSFEAVESSIRNFRRVMHSTSVGITLYILLSLKEESILAQLILSKQGIVLEDLYFDQEQFRQFLTED